MNYENSLAKQVNLTESSEDGTQKVNFIEDDVKIAIANNTLQLGWESLLRKAEVEEAGKYLELAQQYEKKIDTSGRVYKKIIIDFLSMNYLSLEERLKRTQTIIQFAKKRGQDIELTNKDYQEAYQWLLYGGNYDAAKEFASYLKQQGVEVFVTGRMIQKYFKGAFDEGIYLDEARGAIKLAKESGIKFEISKRFLQKMFNEIKQRDQGSANQILELAKENNIELD